MAEQKGWVMVRLKASTKQRLHALAKRLTEAARRGQGKAEQSDQPTPGGADGGVTVDSVVNRALDVYESKLERSRKPRKTGLPVVDELLSIVAEVEEEDAQLGLVDLPGDALEVPGAGPGGQRLYVGCRRKDGTASVWVEEADSNPRPLALRLDLANHSPTGFEWGYCGSGPAQLALAILADAWGDTAALALHQAFKVERIVPLAREGGWIMDRGEVERWVNRRLMGAAE